MTWSLSNPIDFNKLKWENYGSKVQSSIELAMKNLPGLVQEPEDKKFLKKLINFLEESSQWNQIFTAISELNSPVSELTRVSKVSAKNNKLKFKAAQSIYLNKEVWARFGKVDQLLLSGEDLRAYKDLKDCFKELGVHLDKRQQKRLLKIENRISVIENKIQENLRREIKKTPLIIHNEKELKGISQEMCSQAYVKAKKNWRFVLDDGIYSELIDNAENENIRKKAILIARGLGNQKNEYNNHQLIIEVTSLRTEKAKLLGYENYIDYTLQDHMVKSEKELRVVLDNLDKKILLKSKKEIKKYKQIIPEKKFKIWNKFYYKNKMLKSEFSLSQDELKKYFPLNTVWSGLLDFIKTAFKVEFVQKELPRYASDTTSYVCLDLETKEQLGVLYLDLFSREGKGPGAWMQDIVAPGDNQYPWIVLAMNIQKTEENYLSLYEVKTLFHEMGHCLHGLISKANYSCFSGTYVAQDFVELPSQFMENLVFHPQVLSKISCHQETKKSMPLNLVQTLRQYDNFQIGSELLQDLGHCYLDLDLHSNSGLSLSKIQDNCYKNRNLFYEPKGLSKLTHFTHILCGQYSAGYYSYLWSEILDSDCYSQVLKPDGSFDYEQLGRYKQEILKVGSSRDEMESFVKFTGRKPDPSAFLRKRQIID